MCVCGGSGMCVLRQLIYWNPIYLKEYGMLEPSKDSGFDLHLVYTDIGHIAHVLISSWVAS